MTEENKIEPTKENEQETPEQTQDKPEKTFTREEIGAIVAKQLSEAKTKWDADMKDKLQKAKEDGKEEANMTAKELADKQAKDRQEALDQREKDLDARLAELKKSEHLNHTKSLLADEKLPIDIAELLMGDTEEDTKNNIKRYKDAIDQGVRNELHRNSAQQEPQVGSNSNVNKVPDKPIADMNYEEMQAYLESQN